MEPDTAIRSLEIVISDVRPLPKGRPRFVKDRFVNGRFIKGHAYTPATTRRYEKLLKEYFRLACKEPWTGLLALEIRFQTKSRGDADNLTKACVDAGNKILYRDDSQVVRLTTEKIKSAKEEIRIVMQKVGE